MRLADARHYYGARYRSPRLRGSLRSPLNPHLVPFRDYLLLQNCHVYRYTEIFAQPRAHLGHEHFIKMPIPKALEFVLIRLYHNPQAVWCYACAQAELCFG